MKATLTFPNREQAIAFTIAWGRFSRRGHDMTSTRPDGTVAVTVYQVTELEKQWIDDHVASLNPPTPAPQTAILHHLRAAGLARATQWDHEREIEKILGEEIQISDWIESTAAMVDGDAATLTPDDLTWVTPDQVNLLFPAH